MCKNVEEKKEEMKEKIEAYLHSGNQHKFEGCYGFSQR